MAQYMPGPGQDLRTLLQEYERALILGALTSNRGHQRRAAAALGVLPTTLLEKMKRLGIPGRRGRGDALPGDLAQTA